MVLSQLGIVAGRGGSRKNTHGKKKPSRCNFLSPTTSSRLQVLAAVWRDAGHLRTAAEVVLRGLRRAVSSVFNGAVVSRVMSKKDLRVGYK